MTLGGIPGSGWATKRRQTRKMLGVALCSAIFLQPLIGYQALAVTKAAPAVDEPGRHSLVAAHTKIR